MHSEKRTHEQQTPGSATETDLIAAVYEAASQYPDNPALTAPPTRNGKPGKTVSYRELVAGIESTAAALVRDGFGPGERLLFSVRPGPAAFTLALAAVRAGGSIVFIDPGVGPELFRKRTSLASPRWAAAESLLYALSAPGPLRPLARRRGLLLPDYGAMKVRHYHSGPWLPGVPLKSRNVRALSRKGYSDDGGTTGEFASSDPLVAPADPRQEAVIIFTSGTTGHPKGVIHSRGTLAAGFRQLSTRCTFSAGDRIHSEQLMMGLPALIAGAHWTMPAYGLSARIDPLRFAAELGASAAHRGALPYGPASHVFLVPSQMAPILDAIEAGQLSWPATLKTVMLGAAPVLASFLERAMRLLPNVGFHCIYGMTEVLPIAIAGGREKLDFASGLTAEFRTEGGLGEGDYLGEPLPGVEARVAKDHELMVSGPNMCLGYLGEDNMTEMSTGDLVRLDHGPLDPDGAGSGRTGRLVMLGRKKDMIIRGKTNIYPGLYEPLIAGIDGVAQAVLIGVPNAIGDEAVCLVVELSRGYSAEDVKRTMERELPLLIDESALPDRVEVMLKLPGSGRHNKTDRVALRALFSESIL